MQRMNALFFQQVGARLELVIEAFGISKSQAAREMQIDPSKLGHWIAGRHRPDLAVLAIWAKRRQISFDYLFLGDMRHLPKWLADSLDEIAPSQTRRDG